MTSASTRDGSGDFEDDDERPPYRPHPYTIEGYLLGMDDFATGAVAATGWRRTAAVVVAWSVLIPMGLGVLVGVARLVELLLWR
jgi:hypothetical protein